MDWHWTVHW